MNSIFRLVLPFAMLIPAHSAQKPPASQGMPPLIDRELLFGDPEISAAQISPDGNFLAFMKPWKSTRNIWVKKRGEPFDAAKLLTTETKRPIAGYLWSRDGKFIVYVKDNAGDENFNAYAVDPSVKPAASAEAPPSRDLTGLKGVLVQIVNAPKTDPDTLYIGLNDRDKAWHDLYKLKISTGEKTLIRKNTEKIAGWSFDLKGDLRLALRIADNGDQETLRVDEGVFTKVYSCSVFEACGPERFHKDGKRVYFETNKGDSDLTSLNLFDPETGKIELVESDPLKRVDFGAALFSEVTDELVMTNYRDDKVRRYFKDESYKSDYEWLQKKLPGKDVSIASRTRDDQTWLAVASGDTEPGETYLFDRKLKKLVLQYKIREKLPRASLSQMQSIRYKSSDGLEIQAYLTLPKGLPGKGLPLLVSPHGGPWARDEWGYNGTAQFFANRGYAVLQPNFRASTGFGKKFLNAGNGEWGKKMQDDITWGVKHLIAEGIADPKRVGITGGSYGGYATLAGVAFTPDIYRVAVDVVGPSNLITLLDAIPPYWEAGKKMMFTRMADPGTPEGKTWLKERSPLTAADKIKTPLMVVQGANDPRVNRAEAEQIVIALRDRGFPVEYIMAPDEGHGFVRPVNRLAMFAATEKFLAKYLDGRYQEGATPEVAKRLAEITVDPKTVVVTKKMDPSMVSGAPKTAIDLKPAEYKFKANIALGQQQLPVELTTSIKEENGAWVITDTATTPMGIAKDSVIVEKGTLIARTEVANQGPATLQVDFAGNKATGKMGMSGQDRPISVDLGGPLFGQGPASLPSVACLPLAEGYTAAYRNFDVMKQKVLIRQLKVVGIEMVMVPAGMFEAYKVDVTSADGGADKSTMWIAKNGMKPVKVVAVISAMGGATMTAELQ